VSLADAKEVVQMEDNRQDIEEVEHDGAHAEPVSGQLDNSGTQTNVRIIQGVRFVRVTGRRGAMILSGKVFNAPPKKEDPDEELDFRRKRPVEDL
jgi:hypothetical protein